MIFYLLIFIILDSRRWISSEYNRMCAQGRLIDCKNKQITRLFLFFKYFNKFLGRQFVTRQYACSNLFTPKGSGLCVNKLQNWCNGILIPRKSITESAWQCRFKGSTYGTQVDQTKYRKFRR